jgi:uncharacterized lipoprotein
MRRYSLPLILIAALLCLSCQTASRSARVETTQTEAQGGQKQLMPYPKDVVWSALEELLRSRGWIITSRDQDTGILTTSYADVANGSKYARCSGGRQSSLSEYRAQLDVTVERVTANGTNVTIATLFDAADANRRESQARMTCVSNGQLETELFAGVDSVIAARR